MSTFVLPSTRGNETITIEFDGVPPDPGQLPGDYHNDQQRAQRQATPHQPVLALQARRISFMAGSRPRFLVT